MSDSTLTALLSIVCSLFNLGDFTSLPEVLDGGGLHQNWKITTAKGTFVIKKLKGI